jgi:hypothetical protein
VGRVFLVVTLYCGSAFVGALTAQDQVSEGESERVREGQEVVAPQVPHSLAPSLPHSRFEPFQLPAKDRLRIAILTALAIVWFFWLGAAMGSYLNVVVYRMPLGIKSVAPDSRCPKCQTPIRWYDNIPVISWLALRGRCRACREPISPRYVVVEVLMGSLFLGLLCVEVLSGGANLSNRPRRAVPGLPMIEHVMEWDLLGIYCYHAAVLWFLVGIVLFWIDGHRVPKRFMLAGLLVGLLPPLVWPALRQLPFFLAS